MSLKKLTINKDDLPMTVELKGKNGQCEFYMLTPASRKFGACLQKIVQPLRRLVKDNRCQNY